MMRARVLRSYPCYFLRENKLGKYMDFAAKLHFGNCFFQPVSGMPVIPPHFYSLFPRYQKVCVV